jgi:hypothetical protein
MMRDGFVSWVIVVFAIGVAPTLAQKRIADQREYELYQQTGAEREPIRRLAILLEWEAAYPTTDFQRERLLWFAISYKESGQATNAFTRAMQLLKLDSKDIEGLYMIATIAPTLEAPSLDQVRATEDAANNILSRAHELARIATAKPQAVTEAATTQPVDPETERVVRLLREWRRSKRIRTAADVESEFRTVAETALAWVRKSK